MAQSATAHKSAAAFSTEFYHIRNAGSKDARNALIRRTARLGAPLSLLASAAQVTERTVKTIIK